MVVAAIIVVGSVLVVKHIKERRQRKRTQRALEHGTVEYEERHYEKLDQPPEYDDIHDANRASPASSIYSREQDAV
jgi:hypothetical protein